MILQSTSEIESLFEGKHHRLKLTDSLHDFFALNPKYYNKHNDGSDDDDKPAPTRSTTKTVHFADDSSDNNLSYLDFSASTRSLTSIAEETIDLDHTQHSRRASAESMELDTTGHQRKDPLGAELK